MPINWKDPKAFERLIAAVIAAHELKLDYRRIATMYGQGATYDAVEGRFRVFRKEAAKLQQEISNGDRPAAPRRGTSTSTPTTAASSFADSSFADSETSTPKKKAKTATPRKNTNGKGVLTGRVVKNMSNANNPVKKEKGGKGVKTEEEEEGEMDAVGGVAEGLLDEVFGVGALEV